MNQPSAKLMQSSTKSALVEDITLDCDHVLSYAGGDPELLMQLCGNFLRELPIHLQSLRGAINQRNHVAAGLALQQLGNRLLVFGSGQISFTAEMLGAAVRARRTRQAQREWKRLERQFQLLVPQVQHLMLEMSTPKTLLQ